MDKNFTAILFDLGNVLIELQADRVRKCFKSLFKLDYDIYHESLPDFFGDFEKGIFTPMQFFDKIKRYYQVDTDYECFKECWNALLGIIPSNNIDLLKRLRSMGYQLYLLSNTNELHLSCLEEYLLKEYPHFWSLFDRVFLSCRCGMRKPDRPIFEYVLNEILHPAEQVLFIDDGPMNICAAKALGFQTILHPAGSPVESYFEKLHQ